MKHFKTSIRPAYTLIVTTILSMSPLCAMAGWTVDLEGGAAFTGYNDVRIPGNTGTQISLADELKPDATAFARVRITKKIGARQELSLLVAPLRIHGSGSVAREVRFNGAVFPASTPLTSYYRFDSYRLTYRYAVYQRSRLAIDLGLTAKIRDAAIRLDDGSRMSEKKNTGFVPLINFGLDWRFASRAGLLLTGDALAAPQGRAEDVLLAVYAAPSDRLRLRLGYRVLEGGADNEEVYTFALVHYAVAGITVEL